MDGYEKERILARGTFGTVYLCHSKRDPNKQVVIKEISVDVFNGSDRVTALNEARVLGILNHPNIIKYYDSFLNSEASCMYMVMEYAAGGTLFDLIEKRRMNTQGSEQEPQYFKG